MKIKGVHSVCGREVLVQQIVDNGGHCPWDGKPFNAEYTALLTDALARAEVAGTVLVEALEAIADMHGDLVLVEDAVLAEPIAVLGRIRGANPARTG
ncbi:MAG: hypothetical protein WD770_02825 [Actinomycetota bacterium]